METLRTFLETLTDAFEAVMGTWRVSSQFFLMKVLCLSFDTFLQKRVHKNRIELRLKNETKIVSDHEIIFLVLTEA